MNAQHCNTVFPKDYFEEDKIIAGVHLRIDKVVHENDDTNFMGYIYIDPSYRGKPSFLKDQKKLIVEIHSIFKSEFFTWPQMIHFSDDEKNQSRGMWESKPFKIFNIHGSNFSFPFNDQYLALKMSLHYFDEKTKSYEEVNNVQTTVNLVLPKEYETYADRFGSKLADSVDDKSRIIKGDNHICFIQTAKWLKWFVIFLIAFLALPIWLVINKKSPFSSIDFISVLLSIFTVRALLIGNIYDTSIYMVDLIFLTYLFWLAMIPLWSKIEKAISKTIKQVKAFSTG